MSIDWDSWNLLNAPGRIVLIDIVGYSTALAAETTIRFSSKRYFDTINGNQYKGDLVTVPTLSIGTVDPLEDISNVGIGNIQLENLDGRYDGLRDMSFQGRTITARVGPEDPNCDFNDFRKLFVGEVETVDFSRAQIVDFEIRDLLSKIDVDAVVDRYVAGGNIPSGLVGDIKPVAWGTNYSVVGKRIHDSIERYQVSTRIPVVAAIQNNRRNGVPGAAVVSSQNVSAGTYDLTAEVQGVVTGDVIGYSNGGVLQSPGEVIQDILTWSDSNGRSIMNVADIDTASITAFDAITTLESGAFIDSEVNALEVLRSILPIGHLFGFNREGKFFIKQLIDPANAVHTDTLDLSYIVGSGVSVINRSIPNWQLNCHYRRNQTVINNFDVGVNSSARASLSRNYRQTETRSDSTIKDKFAKSQPRDVYFDASSGISGTDEEADRLFALLSVQRETYAIDSWAKPLSFEVGQVVRVTYDRYGMDSGRNLVFCGSDGQLNKSRITGYFWG